MSYTEIATPMPLLPLRYTRDAAPCPTSLDRTGEAVRSTGGVCGGRCEAKATPHYLNLRNMKKCTCARSNPYGTFQSRQKRLRHATLVFIFFVSH